MMKNILFLTNMYPSCKFPSYGIFVKKTYDWLKKENNVTLVKICKHSSKILKIYAYSMFYLKAVFFGIFGKYDCIYAHYISHCALPVSVIKRFKKNIKIIGNVHGEDVFSEYEEFKRNKIQAKKFIEICDFIISPSTYFRNKLCKEYSIDESKVFVSPSGGIDISLFRCVDKSVCRRHFELDNNKKYIGYVSRIEKGKGWDIFLQALTILIHENDGINAIIVGDGTEMELLRQQIGIMKIAEKVKIFPLLQHDELSYIYNSMDIFCFPSRIEAESLGLVGLEAMACEVPSVITHIEGPSSYAKDGYNCLQFNPNNCMELVEKITLLLSEREENIQILKKNARITAEEYDAGKIQKEFLNFFSYILENEVQ